ncbi:carbohydrate ABC transporter permease [Paenibacillus sp. 2TAB23]|uniref:carbohydrate ABC transporter permease n=1 Tax=Paenibacillus sp. 2TAB23 TaxID=3233004 RepID=UPI003F99C42A
MKKRDYTFQIINATIFLFFTFLCIYPFYYIFIASVSDAQAVAMGEVLYFPVGFHLDNFKSVLKLDGILMAFGISAARTIIGTALMLFFSIMLAYVVTKNILPGRKWIYRATVITLFFNAGLIPWFVIMKILSLNNTFWLYVLPGMISPFAVILIKTYMESISTALEESALVDGAGYFTILWRITAPVCLPVIAAVAVFNAVSQWNAWQDNFFLVSNPNLQTLQLMLYNYLQQAESLARAAMQGNINLENVASNKQLDSFSIKTTITMVTVFPIILVYPFMQKFIVKGIMLGSVKG